MKSIINEKQLACSKVCLNNHSIGPDIHIQLTEYGVKKQNHVDFDKNEANEIFNKIKEEVSSLRTIKHDDILCAIN
jgi:uncharacterized metal-binding protein